MRFSLRRHVVLTDDSRAFFALLAKDLNSLNRSLQKGSISLQWSADAMNVLKNMQIELVALFKKSPTLSAEEDGWFDQFMQETAALLDFCNSLKSALSGINRYRMVADLAVQKIVEDGCILSLNTLENAGYFFHEEQKSTRVRVPCSRPSRDDALAAVMLAAKATMVAISLILVSAIVCPTRVDFTGGELVSRFPEMEVLSALVGRFREGPRRGVAERETVESAVGEIKARAKEGEGEGFMESVGLLRTRSAELREGVERFDAAVDEVFDVVIKGRKEMLGIFRDGVLTM